ncbi:hypothetical protein DSM03_10380 [Leeuwenhoekiella aestuarii]|uniref:Uncharacterized protein n=1 Tax=Leeuwenhoekiella aestuarii TaxID=2249426 RepID=A0A4Q0NY56_9FLAO|nr:hypothetical protein DSM03_10380 [Leeuwenhoekiella aestuarii]RXG16589.1 hypothetical protein DSM04_102170 [Leeuwenhoekiella aestuarii]
MNLAAFAISIVIVNNYFFKKDKIGGFIIYIPPFYEIKNLINLKISYSQRNIEIVLLL